MKGSEARARVATISRRDFIKFGAGVSAIMALSARQGSPGIATERNQSPCFH